MSGKRPALNPGFDNKNKKTKVQLQPSIQCFLTTKFKASQVIHPANNLESLPSATMEQQRFSYVAGISIHKQEMYTLDRAEMLDEFVSRNQIRKNAFAFSRHDFV